MKKVCEKLKYNCKFSIVPLARGIAMLQEGTTDGVMSLIPNAERAVYANFSPTVIVSTISYFGAKGKTPKVSSLKDMDGWTVGAVRASSSLKIALENQKEAKNMSIVEETNNETLIKKLQGGRYGAKGAIIGGDAVLEYEAKKVKLELEVVLDGVPQKFTNALSKKSVDAQTLSDLSKTIDDMKKSGEIKAILSKFGLRTE